MNLRHILLYILMMSIIAPVRVLSSTGSNIVFRQVPGGGIVGPIQLEDEITTFDYCGRSALRDAFDTTWRKKELDTMHGLDWYDSSARFYDHVLGRFHQVAPLAEKYYAWSPYAYCMGNPVKFVDPWGKDNLVFFPLHNDEKHNNIAMIEYAMSSPWQKGRVDLFAHGTPQSIELSYIDTSQKIMVKSTEELDAYVGTKQSVWTLSLNGCALDAHDVNIFKKFLSISDEWNNGAQTLVLHSCATGAECVSPEMQEVLLGEAGTETINLKTNMLARYISVSLKGNAISLLRI